MPTAAFSQALLAAATTAAPGFVGVLAVRRGRLVQVNPAGVQLLGYPSEAALLAAPRPLGHAPALGRTAWVAHLARARQHGHAETDTDIRRADGSTFPARVVLTPFAADGHDYLLVRLSGQQRLHQAEQQLVQSVRRFEAVVASATIGIIVCNRAGRMVSANQMAHQQFGYAPGSLPGRSLDQLVPTAPGRHHEQLRQGFNANPSVRAMGAHRGELEGRRQDGSVFPVEVSLSYFYLDEELFVVSYILDITAQRQADQALVAERRRVERLNAELEQKVADRTLALTHTLAQLEQRQQELAQALQAEQELGELKSRFVSMASHEFRTPLTVVLTSVALLEKYSLAELEARRPRQLTRIRQAVNHLNSILEEFLSVGRIEEGQVQARPGRVHLPALLAETVADVQPLARPGQRVELALSGDEQLWLDASLLRKVLVNLLSNALKYSGPAAVVHLRAQARAGQLTISVQDPGIGISAEDQ
ncbi:PAS domain-containing sensor histidine kinase, partial [Hymenobacter sp. NST-14]|uniref:sensor histidine kinase n=1 Tax=Hymenobacter piscis TaxID=2839984 RepID=UPI001C00FF83